MINSLPQWSRARVNNFIDHQKPPMENASKEALTAEDRMMFSETVAANATYTMSLDNSEDDLDPQFGKVVLDNGDGQTKIEYEVRGGTFEAVTSDSETVGYLYQDDNLTQWVSISENAAKEPIQMAVHVDRVQPENSVAYMTE